MLEFSAIPRLVRVPKAHGYSRSEVGFLQLTLAEVAIAGFAFPASSWKDSLHRHTFGACCHRLVIAELMCLQWMDPKEHIYLYINSTGTTRDDGETVGMETEGFAINDALRQLKNEIHTFSVGDACLLLASGIAGKRFMMLHAIAMIQQPRVPSSGLMPASDVLIRVKQGHHGKAFGEAYWGRESFFPSSLPLYFLPISLLSRFEAFIISN